MDYAAFSSEYTTMADGTTWNILYGGQFSDFAGGGYFGKFTTVKEEFFFRLSNPGKLEGKTITEQYSANTGKGQPRSNKTERTELYKCDGKWENLSPDMMPVGQVKSRAARQ